MDDNQGVEMPGQTGGSITLIRTFGWGMLAILAAFLVNNVLILTYDVPSISQIFAADNNASMFVVPLVYLVFLVGTYFGVVRKTTASLRDDAARIHNFNVYFIRACFWSVLLVGLVDTCIALLRVEHFLPIFFDDQTVKNLGRVQFVGPYVHMPLIIAGMVIAFFTRTLGFTWLALLIVVAELLIVISRFVFSYELALMADLVRYWYAALFLFASAYTLYDEGHVRVDILYAAFGRTRKGFFNAIGTIALGMSTCWVILLVGIAGKQSIINSPIMNFEVTQSGSTGLFVKYQMAAFLGIFAISMLIQFVSYFFESVADFRDDPGHREVAAVAH